MYKAIFHGFIFYLSDLFFFINKCISQSCFAVFYVCVGYLAEEWCTPWEF